MVLVPSGKAGPKESDHCRCQKDPHFDLPPAGTGPALRPKLLSCSGLILSAFSRPRCGRFWCVLWAFSFFLGVHANRPLVCQSLSFRRPGDFFSGFGPFLCLVPLSALSVCYRQFYKYGRLRFIDFPIHSQVT